MPYVLRPYRRFPVDLPVTYEHWFREGQAWCGISRPPAVAVGHPSIASHA